MVRGRNGDSAPWKMRSSSLVAPDRLAAADGRGGQQYRQHQHHRLQGRAAAVRGVPDARRHAIRTSPFPTSSCSFTRGLDHHPRHVGRPMSTRPATRSTSRSRARASSSSDAAAANATPAPARSPINAERHPRRSQRQPGAVGRRPDQVRRHRNRHHDRRRRHRSPPATAPRASCASSSSTDPQATAREGNNLYSGGTPRRGDRHPRRAGRDREVQRLGRCRDDRDDPGAARLREHRRAHDRSKTRCAATAIQRLGVAGRVRRYQT